jgi:hypothetical protein
VVQHTLAPEGGSTVVIIDFQRFNETAISEYDTSHLERPYLNKQQQKLQRDDAVDPGIVLIAILAEEDWYDEQGSSRKL